MLPPEVIEDLKKIIKQHHDLAAAAIFGPEAVSSEVWQEVLRLGLAKDPDFPLGRLLHLFGSYQAAVGSEQEEMTLDAFRALAKRQELPQTLQEAASARYANAHAAEYVKGLGGRAAAKAASSVSETLAQTNQELQADVRDIVSARFGDQAAAERVQAKGVEQGLTDDYFDQIKRNTVSGIRSDIGHMTGDWRRDLQRVAQTELHNAVQNGKMDRWQQQAVDDAKALGKPVREPLVYKIPRPGACPHCLRLHLDGEFPRIYKLAHIQGNSNVGKKTRDWKFVVGAVHPWCGCALMKLPRFVRMPDGWVSGQAAPSVVGPGGRLK